MTANVAHDRRADVLIIGGGLHGLSAAVHLGLAGLQTLVLEKDHPGRHASGVNAGGVRSLGRDMAEVPLSVAALSVWHQIESLVDDDCGFIRCGQIKIAENAAEFAALQQRQAKLNALGFNHEELIDANAIRQWVPTIGTQCLGALVCRNDGAANPFRTVQAFRRRALSLGAKIINHCPVSALEHRANYWQVRAGGQRFEAPILINCAGAWGGQVAAWLGEPVTVTIAAPMLMITEPVQPFLYPVLGAQGRTLSFKQFPNGTVLVGGGHLGDARRGENRAVTELTGMAQGAATVNALFPHLRDVRIVRAWAGLESVSADGIPILGHSRIAENVYHSFGYSLHGFQLAPITGKILADLILDKQNNLPIKPFRVDRFSAGASANAAGG